MVKVNSLVLYKNNLALVIGEEKGKFSIKFQSAAATLSKAAVFSTLNVRSKDFILLDEGPASLEKSLAFAQANASSEEQMYDLKSENKISNQIKESWELLLSDAESASAPISFDELSSIIAPSASADEKWAIYLSLKNTVYFCQNLKAQMEGQLVFTPRSQEEIDLLVKKADEKGKEAEIRQAFIKRLKACKLNLPDDGIFMGDVEALALGKSDKSRTMHDAAFKETPERAHKLLLDTGVWAITRNPYPLRWGMSMQSATEGLPSPPEEDRVRVAGTAWAIDSEWSTDPDDAVAWDGQYLWVHIADPASSVLPDSSIDKAARARGSTLYIPEGAARMLCEDCLTDYALGLNEISRALSFRISLDEKAGILDCSVFKTIVDVKRLTYEKADEFCSSPELKPLFDIAEKNIEKRNKAGAVQIQMPEIHLSVDPETKKVSVENQTHLKSHDMIREMMLLAGEGAAKFAFKNNIPFPFVSQEAPTLPEDLPEGLAGQFKLRRCMHKRSVGVTPAMHCGLGIAMYTQVTSPLRRYSDLIAHQQLRAFIDGRPLLDKDTMLMRVSEGDAASQAAHKAERKSYMHWTLVYLLQNPDWTGEAICVDKGGKQPQWSIPSLALETYMTPKKEVELNEKLRVRAANINLPELTLDFIEV